MDAPQQSASDAPSSLRELIESSGRTADPSIDEFTRLAIAIQRERLRLGASNVDAITRSTALLTILRIDPRVRDVLAPRNLTIERLATMLSIRTLPEPAEDADAPLHPDFAVAVREYLSAPTPRPSIGLADIVIAILTAGRDGSSGLLPERLRELGVDLEGSIDAVQHLGDLQFHASIFDANSFSDSVRQVRDALSSQTQVRAAAIVHALALRHPEYGGGGFGRIVLRADVGHLAPVDQWLAEVQALYEPREVAASRHSVIDGELVVLGLAELEPTLAENLTQDGFLDALRAEVEVSPRWLDLAGGFSSDAVDATGGIPLERDRLGVGVYAAMLGTLIADRGTPMPLSIGLFGEWGAGKSFFMGLLREQVRQRADSGSSRYFPNVLQIGFNAWHYADTNLWASLGEEIWRQLAAPAASVGEQREALLAELARVSPRRQELETATANAEAETSRLSNAIASAGASRQLAARELASAVVASPDVGQELETAFRRLGVDDGVERGRVLADAIRGANAELRTTRRVLAGRGALFVVATLALSVALIGLSALATPSVESWLAGTGIASLVACFSVAAVVAERARSGFTTVRRIAERLASSADAEMQHAVNEHIAELRDAEARERVLRAQRDEVVAHIAQLGREIAALTPSERLYALVAERSASDDYRRHLGLISTVRRDFEQLVDRLQAWDRSPMGDSGPRPIDRIVLYIDDLDRCNARQVVQVLQAVHLLLALDLFVVVVGVDPRWLLRSLRDEYPNLLGHAGVTDSAEFQAAPEDYLEKIVNVPFVLPRMSRTAFKELLHSFAETSSKPGSAETADDEKAKPDKSVPAATPEPEPAHLEAEAASEVATIGTEPASTTAAKYPEPRALTSGELALLAELAPLVESPREAKRLMNLYRMVRSTRDLSPAARFIGGEGAAGEYEAVAILLGLVSGHPRLLVSVLAAPPDPMASASGGLRYRSPTGTWMAFAAGIEPVHDGQRWTNAIIGKISDRDLASWRRLDAGLRGATNLVTLSDLTSFQKWAPWIGRFSFLLSPYTFDPHEATTDTWRPNP